MPYLIYQDERKEEIKKEIPGDKIILGRKEDNDLVFYDNLVSRYHAEIERRDDKYFIIDKGSTFGTFVNEEKIVERELYFGDRIRIGRTTLLFLDEKSGSVPRVSLWAEEESLAAKKCKALRSDIYSVKSIIETDSFSDVFSKIEQQIQDLQNYYTDIEKAYKLASSLFEIGKAVNFIFDLSLLLNMIMDLAVKAMGAERGFVMMLNHEDKLEMRVARNFERALITNETQNISHSIAESVVKNGKAVFTTNAKIDDRFKDLQSVIAHDIRAVVCVPLKDRSHKAFGVIYVDSRRIGGLFSESGVEFLAAFASQAAIAIENAHLYEKIKQEERLRTNLQRYLPHMLVEKIVRERGEIYLGGENREITVMFADIRGFTSMSEKLDPHDVVEMLNEFFTLMTAEIFSEGGTLDKYIGDCTMAFFGAPMPQVDHAVRAVRAALSMQRKLEELKKQWMYAGKTYIEFVKDFGMGIGITSGNAVVGNIGTMERMDYTAIGDTVNLAARLEGIAESNQIVVSDSTYQQAKDFIKVKSLDLVNVKGRDKSVKIYLVQGLMQESD